MALFGYYYKLFRLHYTSSAKCPNETSSPGKSADINRLGLENIRSILRSEVFPVLFFADKKANARLSASIVSSKPRKLSRYATLMKRYLRSFFFGFVFREVVNLLARGAPEDIPQESPKADRPSCQLAMIAYVLCGPFGRFFCDGHHCLHFILSSENVFCHFCSPRRCRFMAGVVRGKAQQRLFQLTDNTSGVCRRCPSRLHRTVPHR